jgi:hypothetical protein
MDNDFQTPVFDISNLDEHEIGHVEFILASPSWERVFRPFIERCHNQFIDYLLDPRKDKKVGNEDLIAGARMTRQFLEFFDKVISELQHERAQRAASMVTRTTPPSRAGAPPPEDEF